MSNRAANRSRMEGLVERWGGSGQTIAAFCRDHRISRDKFLYWKRRLSAGGGASKRLELAPVRLVSGRSEPAGGGVEIVLGSGDRLVVREGTSAQLLRDVVAVLRAC